MTAAPHALASPAEWMDVLNDFLADVKTGERIGRC
jgi:hypothetical protein